MSEDATSQPSDPTTTNSSATEDDITYAQQTLADTQAPGDPAETDGETSTPDSDDKGVDNTLGNSGKRALTSERKARRDAERERNEYRTRLQEYEDRDKTELQKAKESAQRYQEELNTTRVANARLMAAAVHNLPPELIDLLGDGTDDEIDARAKLLAEKLTAVAAPAAEEQPRPSPAPTRPVESLVPGARPASQDPEDPNAWLRRMAGRAP